MDIQLGNLRVTDDPDSLCFSLIKDGAQIGTVHAMHNFGAGDLLEIATTAGGEPLLLPFTELVVPNIDTTQRQITIVLPNMIV